MSTDAAGRATSGPRHPDLPASAATPGTFATMEPEAQSTVAAPALAYVAEHPGCVTDQLYAATGAGRNRFAWLTDVHRSARSQGFGQLLDGRWYAGTDSATIAASVRANLPSPGAEQWFSYAHVPAAQVDPAVAAWCLQHG